LTIFTSLKEPGNPKKTSHIQRDSSQIDSILISLYFDLLLFNPWWATGLIFDDHPMQSRHPIHPGNPFDL
jgi:hypothetical protein